MSKGPVGLVVGILAIALIAAGCGGGSDNEISTSSLSKAAYIKKADAACTKGNGEIERDFAAYAKRTHFTPSKRPTKAQVTGLVNVVLIPGIEREIALIRALGAPSGEADRIEAVLGAADEGFETAKDLPRTVLENPSIAFGVAGRLAKEYGLGVCFQK